MPAWKRVWVTLAASIKTRLDVTNSDKHSSLLLYIFNYGYKIFDALMEKDMGNLGCEY
jgi:hypothetical protein